MAKLGVELCGKLADPYGPLVTIDVGPDGLSIAQLLQAVGANHPLLLSQFESGRIRACINEAIVLDNAIVRAGDTAALFPPVSGG